MNEKVPSAYAVELERRKNEPIPDEDKNFPVGSIKYSHSEKEMPQIDVDWRRDVRQEMIPAKVLALMKSRRSARKVSDDELLQSLLKEYDEILPGGTCVDALVPRKDHAWGALVLGNAQAATSKNLLDELYNKYTVRGIVCLTNEVIEQDTENFQYLNIQAEDVEGFDLLKYFDHTFRFIERFRNNGYGVLVHCHMGVNRSTAVVIHYLMRKFKWTADYARSFVQVGRPVAQAATFMRQLRGVDFDDDDDDSSESS